jgi:ATP-dependent protease ClpP protease subunit
MFALNASKGTFKAEGNTIYIYDLIVGSDAEAECWGGVSPEAFARTLSALTGPVSLRINSPGGDVFAAQAMRAAMANYPGKITAFVDGYAASAASVLAVCADKCVMAPGGFMMIHKAWTLGMGNADDLKQTAALLEKIDATLADTYAKKAGGKPQDFAQQMTAETWFTAEEALASGLADEIQQPVIKASAPKLWDLTAYESRPADSLTVTVTVEVDEEPEPPEAEGPSEEPVTPEAPDGASEDRDRRIRQHAVRMALATA